MLSKEEIAYAAGFFDGEGWLAAFMAHGLAYKVGIGQTNKEVLKWIQSRWGGSLRWKDVPNNKLSKKPAGQLHLSGNFAYKFLNDVYPYLIVRREEVKMMQTIWETRKNLPTRELLLTQWKNRRAA